MFFLVVSAIAKYTFSKVAIKNFLDEMYYSYNENTFSYMTSTSYDHFGFYSMTDDIRKMIPGASIEYLNEFFLEKGEKIQLIWTYKDKTLDILYVYPADSMYEYVLDTVYYASEHKWIYNGVQIWPRESEPDITLEEYLGVNGTSQEEIEKEYQTLANVSEKDDEKAKNDKVNAVKKQYKVGQVAYKVKADKVIEILKKNAVTKEAKEETK